MASYKVEYGGEGSLSSREKVRVGALNLDHGCWSGYDFTGSSSLPTSPGTSCSQLRAEFKVPYAKLKDLKPDHFFETKIAPGSHAPEHHHACFADDGCTSETFEWKGAVSVARES